MSAIVRGRAYSEGLIHRRNWGYSRLDTQDIAHSPCLISVLLVGLSDGVDVVDTNDPLFLLELYIAAKVM